MEGYCTTCRAMREIKNPKTVVTNFKPTIWGTCPICGNVMSREGEEKDDITVNEDWKIEHIGIKIERPYGGLFDDEIRFVANEGANQAGSNFYLGSRHWARIGKALISFSRKAKGEYSFKIGSAKFISTPPLNSRPWFLFRALRTTSSEGNTALQVTTNPGKYLPAAGEISLLITAKSSAIQRLGKLLIEFSHPKYKLLKWSVKGDVDALIVDELWPFPKYPPTLQRWGNEPTI